MWVLVPARAGSKGIPRKNLKPLCGKPLVSHVLDRLSTELDTCGVVLSTDSREIADLAPEGTLVHFRSMSNSDDAATLDDVAVEAASWLLTQGARPTDVVITVQPTSPWIKAESIERALVNLVAGSGSVLSVRDDRHLRWSGGDGDATPLYSARVNRQSLPEEFAETGGFIGARIVDILEHQTRIVPPISLLPLPEDEAVDIDTPADWALAEHYGTRLKIAIRADANHVLGTGHIRRAIALANELRVLGHNVVLVTQSDDEMSLAARLLEGTRVQVIEISSEMEFGVYLASRDVDIAILDVLDTTVEQVEDIRNYVSFVVAFEDLGPGRLSADLVVNHLYPTPQREANVLSGVSCAILAPEFENVAPRPQTTAVERILLAFGGSDPSNLTTLALDALSDARFDGEVDVLIGPGFAHELPSLNECGLRGQVVRNPASVLEVMSTADLALTSAGRTVTELMHLGVPTVAMCQNVRELSHSHATSAHGVLNLGLGSTVARETLAAHIELMLEDHDFRGLLAERMLEAVRGRTNATVVERILQLHANRNEQILHLPANNPAHELATEPSLIAA